MLLSPVDDLREELGFDDMADITSAITDALLAADPVIQARLGTAFDRVTLTDYFYADAPGYEEGRSVRTEFRLTRGFLVSAPNVVMADAMEAFGSSSEVVLAGFVSDLEKGVVRDIGTRFERAFVKITYTAGFEVDDNAYKPEQVPLWLQQAAKLKAKLFLAGSAPLKAAQVEIDTKTISTQVETLLSQKVRYTPVALLPL